MFCPRHKSNLAGSGDLFQCLFNISGQKLSYLRAPLVSIVHFPPTQCPSDMMDFNSQNPRANFDCWELLGVGDPTYLKSRRSKKASIKTRTLQEIPILNNCPSSDNYRGWCLFCVRQQNVVLDSKKGKRQSISYEALNNLLNGLKAF